MDQQRAEQLAKALATGADELNRIALTAARNKKSIAASGPYADRFHTAVIALTRVENLLAPVLSAIPGFDNAKLKAQLTTAKSPKANLQARDDARKQVRLICETEVLPQLGNISSPVQPSAEPVLPAAVMSKAPTYLQRTLLQANGCYMNRWYDASSVMIRKLVENLIIDVYEVNKREAEI